MITQGMLRGTVTQSRIEEIVTAANRTEPNRSVKFRLSTGQGLAGSEAETSRVPYTREKKSLAFPRGTFTARFVTHTCTRAGEGTFGEYTRTHVRQGRS